MEGGSRWEKATWRVGNLLTGGGVEGTENEPRGSLSNHRQRSVSLGLGHFIHLPSVSESLTNGLRSFT